MNGIMDTIMLILFVIFMFFIFGGYHRQKFEEREEEQRHTQDGKADDTSDAPSPEETKR